MVLPSGSRVEEYVMASERRSIDQRLEQARAKLHQLEAQAATRKKKTADRQKIIVGATVINAMEADAELKGRVIALLNQYVTRPLDRAAVAQWLSRT